MLNADAAPQAFVNTSITAPSSHAGAARPGAAVWPRALEAALDRLADLHQARSVFGINYQRARGFARALSEALAAPETNVDTVLERAAAGRPLVAPLVVERRFDLETYDVTRTAGTRVDAFALQLEIATAYDEGLALARRCLASLSPAERVGLPWLLGREVPRATIYERVFRLARLITGAAN